MKKILFTLSLLATIYTHASGLTQSLNDRINATCWAKPTVDVQVACYAYLVIDSTRSEHGIPQIDELSIQIEILTQQIKRSRMGNANTFIPAVLQNIGFIYSDLKRVSDPNQTSAEYMQNLDRLDESLRMLRAAAGL